MSKWILSVLYSKKFPEKGLFGNQRVDTMPSGSCGKRGTANSTPVTRRTIWQATKNRVRIYNDFAGIWEWTFEMNQFADLKKSEFVAIYCSGIRQPETRDNTLPRTQKFMRRRGLSSYLRFFRPYNKSFQYNQTYYCKMQY